MLHARKQFWLNNTKVPHLSTPVQIKKFQTVTFLLFLLRR